MGISMKCTVWIGRKWEVYAYKYILPGSKLMTNKSRKYPYDILFEGMRVNVKATKLYRKKKGFYFNFTLHKHYESCDFFLLIGYKYARDREAMRAWFIPAELLQRYNATISPNHRGKWKPYEIEIMKRPEKEGRQHESRFNVSGTTNPGEKDLV